MAILFSVMSNMFSFLQCLGFTPFSVFVALALATFSPLVLANHDFSHPVEVKYYSRGNSPGLWPYQNALLLLALEKTRKEYGDYSITYYSEVISSSRAKLETERGNIINVHYSTGWDGEFVDENNVIKIRYPILKGLLGMRNMVIRKQELIRFSKIKSFQQMQKLKAGQGASWYDVSILRNQGIPVVLSELFSNLAPMLIAKRFDYIPLSVLEANAAIDSVSSDSGKLLISPNIALFYPLPIHLCVSKSVPALAERLDKGLALTIADGSMESLFLAHFSFVQKELNNKKLKTFLISNPHLSYDENRQLTESFLSEYGSRISVVGQVIR